MTIYEAMGVVRNPGEYRSGWVEKAVDTLRKNADMLGKAEIKELKKLGISIDLKNPSPLSGFNSVVEAGTGKEKERSARLAAGALLALGDVGELAAVLEEYVPVDRLKEIAEDLND